MRKTKTPSFTLSLKLNTTRKDDRVLAKRFRYASIVRNRLVSHARKTLSTVRQDKEYRALMDKRSSLKGKGDSASERERTRLNKELSLIRERHGLSEYGFHDWIAVQQHRYSKHIDSHAAQKLATSVWRSVGAVLFRKGKSVHFARSENLLSVEGKNNAAGIRFKDGRLEWFGLSVQPQIRRGDSYAREALKHHVKYCRIKRMSMGTSWDYYLELVLEGIPPEKHRFISGRVGIDQGTSSEAVFSEHGCILAELAPDRPEIESRVRRLSRRLDRSRRATNPDNYNPDGTVKKGRKRWVKSKSYRKDQMRFKTLRRRNAATVKQSEEMLANEILCNHGTNVITERMDYKALQAKAKEDVVSPKTGRHRSRKRFGKSLSKHSPGKFMTIVGRKLSYIGKVVNHVDTWKFKASQYDHVTGGYIPAGLSERSKTVGGSRVQRDLYSAFLLWAALDDTTVDRDLCLKCFPAFLEHQGACISRLKENKRNLSSFGLADFAA